MATEMASTDSVTIKAVKSKMPNCPKCGKPVYFAERKCSLGYDWHPNCLRCQSCNKALHPGKHSEHAGKPYCDIPCYQALFGPGGFGRGGVESYQYFQNDLPPMSTQEKNELMTFIKRYNVYKKGVEELHCVETNGRLVFEGILKIYWGLKKPITVLSERQLMRRGSQRVDSIMAALQKVRARLRKRQELDQLTSIEEKPASEGTTSQKPVATDGDEVDSLPPQPRRRTATLPVRHVSSSTDTTDGSDLLSTVPNGVDEAGKQAQEKRAHRNRSSSLKRRSRAGSFRKALPEDDKPSSFTPPYGSVTNLRVSNVSNMREVIQMLLIKFKVINDPNEFSLYIMEDTGVIKRCSEEESPLMTRLKLGPSEDLAKIYIMDINDEDKGDVSAEAAEYIKFSLTELEWFLRKFQEEEEKAIETIHKKFDALREPIVLQISELRTRQTCSPLRETEI